MNDGYPSASLHMRKQRNSHVFPHASRLCSLQVWRYKEVMNTGKASRAFASIQIKIQLSSSRVRHLYAGLACETGWTYMLQDSKRLFLNKLFPARDRWCFRATNARRRGFPCTRRLRRRHETEALTLIRSRFGLLTSRMSFGTPYLVGQSSQSCSLDGHVRW